MIVEGSGRRSWRNVGEEGWENRGGRGIAGEEDDGRGGGAADGGSWRRTRIGVGGERKEQEMGFGKRMTSKGEGAFGEAGRWPEACRSWRLRWRWRWRQRPEAAVAA